MIIISNKISNNFNIYCNIKFIFLKIYFTFFFVVEQKSDQNPHIAFVYYFAYVSFNLEYLSYPAFLFKFFVTLTY